MNQPAQGEPTITRLMLDTMTEIKGAVKDMAAEQVQQGLRLQRALSDGESLRDKHDALDEAHDETSKRVDALAVKVDDLKRIAWLLTIIGGILVAVITSAVSDFVGTLIDRPDRRPAPHQTTEE